MRVDLLCRSCVRRNQPANGRSFVCDGGFIREVVSEAAELSLSDDPAPNGTMPLPSQLAHADTVRNLSLPAATAAASDRRKPPTRADGTNSVDSMSSTAPEAPPTAGEPALADGITAALPGGSAPDMLPSTDPGADSRPIDQLPSPSDVHTEEPEQGGVEQTACSKAERSAGCRHFDAVRAVLPRAVAWEVPARSPSQAVPDAGQVPRQCTGEGRQLTGGGDGPLNRISAWQTAVGGQQTPPAQSKAAPLPGGGGMPSFNSADRCALPLPTRNTVTSVGRQLMSSAV